MPDLKIDKDDILIVLMGPSGAGKSHFIDLLLNERGRRAGKSLKPITTKIRASRFHDHPRYGDRIVLVDTPSFDNAAMPDMEILQHIGDWLRKTYQENVKLTGLLYLYQISGNRLGGAPMKNLRLFEELCGDDSLKRVTLVTTMWQSTRKEDAEKREHELKTEYWKPFIDRGSRVNRLEQSDRNLAWQIIDNLIRESTAKEAIQLQQELVDYRRRLIDTRARKTLSDELQQLLLQHMQAMEAMEELLTEAAKSTDPTFVRELKEEYAATEKQFRETFDRIKRYKPKALPTIIIEELKNELMQLRSKRDDVTHQSRLSQPGGILNFQQFKLPRLRAEPTRSRLTVRQYLQALVSDIIRDHSCRKLVCALERDDAQHVVDYLSLVLQEAGNLASDEKERILSLLYNLAKSAMVYPQYHLLKDVTRDVHPIAGGGFADVYKGKHEKHTICLKVVRVFQNHDNPQLMRAHLKEVILWPQLSHPSILPFYGVYLLDEPSQRISLVSPWMENGNMSAYLKKHPETPCIPLLVDIVSGLAYLHQSSVVHGDLKAANILISDDGRALITDFGLSYVAIGSGLASSLNGTMRWTAPELLADDSIAIPPTRESDVWSFGCLCYEVLTGKIPFHGYSDKKVLVLLSSGSEPEARPLPGENCNVSDDGMWGLMKSCWNYEPLNRPSCEIIGESIVGLHSQDDRGEFSTRIWDTAARFRKVMRKKSGAKVDYRRVEEIVLRIQKGKDDATAERRA